MIKTLRQEFQGELEEKKSLFIARIFPITSEEEAKEKFETIKKKEKGARHNVFAYRLRSQVPILRYSDDGEPQGTAGQPILHVLESQALWDVMVVVTRYFGGILLGASGLSRAYGGAAAEAVKNAKVWQVIKGDRFTVHLPYDVHARLGNLLAKTQVVHEEYTHEVVLTIVSEQEASDDLRDRITEESSGKAILSPKETGEFYLGDEGELLEMDQ